MVTPLTLGRITVMTSKTTTADGAMIKPGHMPADGGVAVITAVITPNVPHRLSGRIGVIMTPVAHHWCTLKLPFVMALITLYIAVFTGQGKAG
jgi:hypothetical protein